MKRQVDIAEGVRAIVTEMNDACSSTSREVMVAFEARRAVETDD